MTTDRQISLTVMECDLRGVFVECQSTYRNVKKDVRIKNEL